jgi:hypothetical protein
MGSDKEMGHAYEGTRVPTREMQIAVPLQVPLLDPQTGKMAPTTAPSSLDEGAEKFYKPLLDGIREVVVKRGLSERVINLGVGGDKRPSENTANKFRAWAPYARWYLYSHFSGDPGPTPEGKMIATGGMEIGVKACPDSSMSGMDWVFPNGIALNRNEDGLLRKVAGPLPEYLVPMVNRGTGPDMLAGPMAFRTSPLIYGRWSQLGIDSWPDTNPSARLILIWGATVNWLAARGPKGLLPTVRYQMIREGLQDFEASMDTMEKVLAMPAEQQAANRAALDLRRDLMNRVFNIGSSSLHAPATESSTDWESLFARHHEAAATLAGVKIEAKWQDPPR